MCHFLYGIHTFLYRRQQEQNQGDGSFQPNVAAVIDDGVQQHRHAFGCIRSEKDYTAKYGKDKATKDTNEIADGQPHNANGGTPPHRPSAPKASG